MERLSKKPRLGPAPYDSEDDELNYDPEELSLQHDPQFHHAVANFRLKSTFEHIFAKYERDFDGIGDEVDLVTGRTVVDNGHLQNMRNEKDTGKEDPEDDVDGDDGILGLAPTVEQKKDRRHEEDEDEDERILFGSSGAQKKPSTSQIPKTSSSLNRLSTSLALTEPSGPRPGDRLAALAPQLQSSIRSSLGSWASPTEPAWTAPEIERPTFGSIFGSRLYQTRYNLPVRSFNESIWNERPDAEIDLAEPAPEERIRVRLKPLQPERPHTVVRRLVLPRGVQDGDDGDDILGLSEVTPPKPRRQSSSPRPGREERETSENSMPGGRPLSSGKSGGPDRSDTQDGPKRAMLLKETSLNPSKTSKLSRRAQGKSPDLWRRVRQSSGQGMSPPNTLTKDTAMEPIPPRRRPGWQRRSKHVFATKVPRATDVMLPANTPEGGQKSLRRVRRQTEFFGNPVSWRDIYSNTRQRKQVLVVEIPSARISLRNIDAFRGEEELTVHTSAAPQEGYYRAQVLPSLPLAKKLPAPAWEEVTTKKAHGKVIPDSQVDAPSQSSAPQLEREQPRAAAEKFYRNVIDPSYEFSDNEDTLPRRKPREQQPPTPAEEPLKAKVAEQKEGQSTLASRASRKRRQTSGSSPAQATPLPAARSTDPTGDVSLQPASAVIRRRFWQTQHPSEQGAVSRNPQRVMDVPRKPNGADAHPLVESSPNHVITEDSAFSLPREDRHQRSRRKPAKVSGEKQSERPEPAVSNSLLPPPHAWKDSATHVTSNKSGAVLSPDNRHKKPAGKSVKTLTKESNEKPAEQPPAPQVKAVTTKRRPGRVDETTNMAKAPRDSRAPPRAQKPKPKFGDAQPISSSSAVPIVELTEGTQKLPRRPSPMTPQGKNKPTDSMPNGSSSRLSLMSFVCDDEDELSIDLGLTPKVGSTSATVKGRDTRLASSGSRPSSSTRKGLYKLRLLASAEQKPSINDGESRHAPNPHTPKKTAAVAGQLGTPIQTPGGTMRRCGEDGFRCDRDFCFSCL